MVDSEVEQLPAKFVEMLDAGLTMTEIDRAIERVRASYWRRAICDYKINGVVSEKYQRAAENYREFVESATWAYQRVRDGVDIDERPRISLIRTWRAIEFGCRGESLTAQVFVHNLSTITGAINLVLSAAPPIVTGVRVLENFASFYHATNSK